MQARITALYGRLSKEDLQAGESESIQHQKIILQKYADEPTRDSTSTTAFRA